MNIRLFFVAAGFLWVMGCQQSPDTRTATEAEGQDTLATVQPAIFSTPSNQFFRSAKEAYRQGDLSHAANDIRQGVEAWSEEVSALDTLKQLRMSMVNKLKELADQTEAGEVYNASRLDELFSEAALLGAQLELESSLHFVDEAQYVQAVRQGQQAIARVDEMLTYTGRTIEQDTRVLLNDTKSMLGRVAQSDSTVTQELPAQLEAVRTALLALAEPADVVQNNDTTLTDNP